MKKLILFLLVGAAFVHGVKSLKRAQEKLVERKAIPQRTVPEVPQFAQPTAAVAANDWMAREQERLRQEHADQQRRFFHEVQFGAKCAQARGNLSAIQVAERMPSTHEVKRYDTTGPGRPKWVATTEAERSQARAEAERFIAENCRQ